MKIFRNNKVYVQLNDIAVIMHSELAVPRNIFLKVIGDGKPFVVADHNRFDLVEFEDGVDIQFFRDCDWIPDYDEYIGLSKKEFIESSLMIQDEMNEIAKKYNSLSSKIKYERHDLVARHDLLQHKFYNVKDISDIQNGNLVVPLPEGMDVPKKKSTLSKIKEFLKK